MPYTPLVSRTALRYGTMNEKAPPAAGATPASFKRRS
nr:MAG TPA: hypothetical protein [Caudoviricetes sp.]